MKSNEEFLFNLYRQGEISKDAKDAIRNRLEEVEKLLVAVYEEWKDSENIKTPEMDGFELLNKIKDWVQEASHDSRKP